MPPPQSGDDALSEARDLYPPADQDLCRGLCATAPKTLTSRRTSSCTGAPRKGGRASGDWAQRRAASVRLNELRYKQRHLGRRERCGNFAGLWALWELCGCDREICSEWDRGHSFVSRSDGEHGEQGSLVSRVRPRSPKGLHSDLRFSSRTPSAWPRCRERKTASPRCSHRVASASSTTRPPKVFFPRSRISHSVNSARKPFPTSTASSCCES